MSDNQMAASTGLTSWAARPLDIDHAAMFASFERAANVLLIATFEPLLMCCTEAENLADVVGRSVFAPYDFLPVRQGEEIVGLLNRTNEARALDSDATEPHRTVLDAMHPLEEAILISSEASLLTFVASADEHPCRLVISETKIDGIVTVADIQKLPVRPILFLLVTHLEMLMAEALRAAFPDGDGWLRCLKPPRRKLLEEKCVALRHGDMELDKLVAAEFCDKKEALIGSNVPLLCGNGKAAEQIERIEKLRNQLAHAGEYAGTREAAAHCAKTVRLTQSWITHLKDWVSAHEKQLRR